MRLLNSTYCCDKVVGLHVLNITDYREFIDTLILYMKESMKKSCRDNFNEIRERLKAKDIFRTNTLRVNHQLMLNSADAPIQILSPGFPEQSFNQNIQLFEERYDVIEKIGS